MIKKIIFLMILGITIITYSEEQDNKMFTQITSDAAVKVFEEKLDSYKQDKDGIWVWNGLYFQNMDARNLSFKVIDKYYAVDSSTVFYKGFRVSKMDPQTFEVIKYSYSKDKNEIVYGMITVKGADMSTFKVLGKYYASDTKNIYYCSTIFSVEDASSFSVLDGIT